MAPSDMDAVVGALRAADRVVVTSHDNPDGDALGSLLATELTLRAMGKDATGYLCGEVPLPNEYRFMGLDDLQRGDAPEMAGRVLVAVDCANESRLGREPERILGAAELVVNIDHHHDNTRFGDVNLIEGRVLSAGLGHLVIESIAGGRMLVAQQADAATGSYVSSRVAALPAAWARRPARSTSARAEEPSRRLLPAATRSLRAPSRARRTASGAAFADKGRSSGCPHASHASRPSGMSESHRAQRGMLPTASHLRLDGREGRPSRWRQSGYKRSDLDIEGDNDMARSAWMGRGFPWLVPVKRAFPKSFK